MWYVVTVLATLVVELLIVAGVIVWKTRHEEKTQEALVAATVGALVLIFVTCGPWLLANYG